MHPEQYQIFADMLQEGREVFRVRLFVGVLMSCLRCLCLFAYSGVFFDFFCLRPVCLVCPILPVSLGLSICYCTRHTGRRQKKKNNTPLYANKYKQRKQDMSPPTND
jgi:hypothetical protein